MSTNLQWALAYARHGRSVFPCIEHPGDYTKGPYRNEDLGLVNGHTNATCDTDIIRTWWKRYPRALIGSPVPVGQVCVDIDPRHNTTQAMLELEVGELPYTQAVLSGRLDGGIHLFFWRPLKDFGDRLPEPSEAVFMPFDTSKRSTLKQKFPSGLDIKTDTGYTILPPSLHPDTKCPYEWRDMITDNPLDYPIHPLPAQLAAILLEDADRPKFQSPIMGHPNVRQLEGILRTVYEGQNGERNLILYWGACRLVENGYGEAAFQELANAARHGGLTDREITKTINSARRGLAA